MNETGRKIKLVFLGAGSFAVAVLAALLRDRRIGVPLIATQVDKPAGRRGVLTPTPLGKWCDGAGVVCERVASVNSPAFLARLRRLKPDLAVVAAFGQLLNGELLNLPSLGCLNVHASLLPKYRGASPVASAILNGETITGVSFMRMDKGLDTGPVYRRLETAVDGRMTAPELEAALAQLAAGEIGDCVCALAAGNLSPEKQNDAEATAAPKIRKAQAALNWNSDAQMLARKIRAFHPWPSVVFILPRAGRRTAVKISAGHAKPANPAEPAKPGTILAVTAEGIAVACGSGTLFLEKVIPDSKKEMKGADFAHGFRLAPGLTLLNGSGIPTP